MIIGILSDTHGDAGITRVAVRMLRDAGSEFLFHCGDVCGESVLDELAGGKAAFVFGNNDDHDALRRHASSLGVECLGVQGGLHVGPPGAGGGWVGMTHGDRPRVVQQMLSGDSPWEYVLTGHSHQQHDRRIDGIRWINPGALYRAAVKTVATLDLATATLAYHVVPVDQRGR